MSPHDPLYARGPYRVIAAPVGARVPCYVVVDIAGAWLREEPNLDAARQWIDLRLAGEIAAPSRVPAMGR